MAKKTTPPDAPAVNDETPDPTPANRAVLAPEGFVLVRATRPIAEASPKGDVQHHDRKSGPFPVSAERRAALGSLVEDVK